METSQQGYPNATALRVTNPDYSYFEKRMKIREHHGIMVPLEFIDLFEGMIPSPDVPCPWTAEAMEELDRMDTNGSAVSVSFSNVASSTERQANSSVGQSQAPRDRDNIATTDTGNIEAKAAENTATSKSADPTKKSLMKQELGKPTSNDCAVAGPKPSAKAAIQAPSQRKQMTRRPSLTHKPILGKAGWRRSTMDDKFAAAASAAEKSPFAKAFTLNLSPRCEQTLRDHQNPTRLLSLYLRREMQQFVGQVLPYSFCLEVSPEGRLHVHGVIVLDSDDKEHVKVVKRALARAGGPLPGRAGSRQVCFRVLKPALGWTDYILKGVKRTRKVLETEKTIFISRELLLITRDMADQTDEHFPGVSVEPPGTLH
ncbi:hypothetical protein [Hoeflea sp.]|uniref:hypothetical protein n=1 Tax=Hoeflea sp. TaxID=1940281 RepID=UPI003A8E1C69